MTIRIGHKPPQDGGTDRGKIISLFITFDVPVLLWMPSFYFTHYLAIDSRIYQSITP